MNSIDILKAKEVNIKLDKEDLVITLDGSEHRLNYEAISHTESLLLRLAFSTPRVTMSAQGTVITPGQDTSVLFEEKKDE